LTLFIDTFLVSHRIRQRRTKVPSFTAAEKELQHLLLFGGNPEVETRHSVIVIDGRVKLSANARIGALIRGLRGKMDDPLAQKIKDPTINISDTPEMKLIVNLLFTDGLGG
jgi:hypothetical protein